MKWVFISILALRCVFIALPDTLFSPFMTPMAEDYQPVRVSLFGWQLLDKLAFVALSIHAWNLSKRRVTEGAFVVVMVLDVLDYVLTSNAGYINVGKYPVTGNVLMVVFYIILTWKDDDKFVS